MQKRVIDKRIKEKFMVDDEYLNGMAKLCGWQGTIVYNSICRHSNKNQESFPSIKLMSEQHNVGRKTILKGIDNLEKRKVIEVKKTRSKAGKWLNNTYILLDKSEWIYNQVPVGDTASQVPVGTHPSPCGDTSQVPVGDTKETHIKETHITCVADATGWSFREEIKKIAGDKRKDLKIIALYWVRKKIVFENKQQFQTHLKRELRPAKELIGYSKEQIEQSIDYCEKEYKVWTLETVGKRIADLVNKI